MGIARSTYYEASGPTLDDASLVAAIVAICDEFEAYGWRRVRAALRQQGVIANHKRIRRLMREHGLQPRVRRRFVATTNSDHDGRSSLTVRRTWCSPGASSFGSPI